MLACLQTLDEFEDGQNLPTLLTSTLDDNLTAIVEDINNQTQVLIASFGTIVRIVTPPAYACNVSPACLNDALTSPNHVTMHLCRHCGNQI